MAITVQDVLTPFNTIIGDTSEDRITNTERYAFITEATQWVMEVTNNDLMNSSYVFNYYDTVHAYKVTTSIPDILDLCDMTRSEDDHTDPFSRLSPRDIKIDIANGESGSAFALERKDGNWYLLVNHDSKYTAQTISAFESTTDGGGTWTADTTNSDATNVTLDSNEYTDGVGSLNFDVDVSQSGNNRATIYNSSLDSIDLSDYENLASFVVEVYIPTVTNFTSITLYWGSSDSAYWSVTATTDINGNSLTAGWNTVRFAWASATETGTADETAITYVRFDFNYGAGYSDATDFRIDSLRVVRPEPLTFLYTSNYVGTNSSGTDLRAFTAASDIPYYSGQYDGLRFAVAHKAAALAFRGPLRLRTEAVEQDNEAELAVTRAMKIVPSSTNKETRNFKVAGISFKRRR